MWKPGPVLLDSGKCPDDLSSPTRWKHTALENKDGRPDSPAGGSGGPAF